MRRPDRISVSFIAAAILFTAAVFGLQKVGMYDGFDQRLADRLLEPRAAASDIVIVAIDDASINKEGVWPWPRALHAQMVQLLTQAGAKAIGYDVTFSEASTPVDDDALRDALVVSGRVVLASEPALQPTEGLRQAAPSGDASLLPSPDGVVRLAPTNDTFARRVLEAAGGSSSISGVYRIPFVGPAGSFKTVSFADVLDGTVPASAFANKIVLVGSTAADLHDAALTPMGNGSLTPGVEIQANIVQGLREGREINALTDDDSLALFAALAALVLLFAAMRLRYFLIATTGLVVIYLLTAVAQGASGFLLPILWPLALVALLTATNLAFRYVREKWRRAQVQDAFGHYLSPKVIEQIIKGDTKLELGGVRRELTILFSDIRGFTTLSEKLTPEQLVSLLNEYLTAMTDLVLGSDGVVDKYIGDAIMAFWGAPLPQSDHAVRAAETALAMKARLGELQTKWQAEGKPEVNIGVGINSGNVIIGNMGSKQRFDYTVMGDDVNLASRLEGLTKQYGVTILVSEATLGKLGGRFVTRPIDLVAVKGKTQPVNIFELLEADKRPLATAFTAALELYRSRRWDDARTAFEAIGDKASHVYAERCDLMKQNDPGPDWDGVYVAISK